MIETTTDRCAERGRSAVYRFDAEGREQSATVTTVDGGGDDAFEVTWTWTCP